MAKKKVEVDPEQAWLEARSVPRPAHVVIRLQHRYVWVPGHVAAGLSETEFPTIAQAMALEAASPREGTYATSGHRSSYGHSLRRLCIYTEAGRMRRQERASMALKEAEVDSSTTAHGMNSQEVSDV